MRIVTPGDVVCLFVVCSSLICSSALIAFTAGMLLSASRITARYRFESADEALKVLDIVRDGHIYSACEAILYGGKEKKRLDPASLSAEQKQRLRRTALAWTEAMDPFIRGFAVSVGL